MIIKENFKKNPRYLAVLILTTLEKKNILLDSLIEDNENNINQLQPRDKALFFNIVYGVLRKKGNLDKIILRNSKKNIKKVDKPVLNSLRAGIYQMVYLEKIPPSAAVNTSVEVVKKLGFKSAGGFVNGILRTFLKEFDKDKFFKYEKNSSDFPKWMIKRWENRFNKKDTEKLCSFYNSVPPITLRVNTIKTTRKDLVEMLSKSTENIWQNILSKDSISLVKPKTQVHKLPGFKRGFFQVQDSGAQIVTTLLQPKAGDKILDSCAGLGGKTGHLAQLAKGKADITAVDLNPGKLEKLEEEMLRMGFSNSVKTMAVNLSSESEKINSDYFNKILIDAPCSGLGVLRRNPDTKWKRVFQDIKDCSKNQRKILGNCAKLLKKDGYLLYTVCSFEPEETTEVINNFLNENPNFKRAEVKELIGEEYIDENGDIIILPHKSKTDGFFASLLKKDKKK